MRVVAFDMGIRNFAFAIMDIDEANGWGYVRYIDTHDLMGDGGDIHRMLIVYLDRYFEWWRTTDVVLIEQQLKLHNFQAARLACHVAAYFYHRLPSLPVHDYPSTYKTRYFGAIRSLDHKGRKRFAVDTVLVHYKDSDPVLCEWLSSFPKKDDIADCILMAATFHASPFFYYEKKIMFNKKTKS